METGRIGETPCTNTLLSPKLSRVCSADSHLRLGQISQSIDALATEAAADGSSPPDWASRIAQLWEMMAELNPELASRLPGYCPELAAETEPPHRPA